MEFVLSVGWITIIGLAFLGLIYFAQKENDSEEERKLLVSHNEKCQQLIREYNESVIKEKPIMSNIELKRRLKEILREPGEKEKALLRIEELKNRHEATLQKFKENRKVGYKYQEEIFEIFEKERKLTQMQVIAAIKNKFRSNETEAYRVFDIWMANSLIGECPSQVGYWEVGLILTSDSYKIESTDLTFEQWLEQRSEK